MANKKTNCSLDTNIILRLLVTDVPEQAKKAEVFIAEKSSCEIADLALTETVFVLEKLYLMPREQIVNNLYAIIRNPKFNCNKILFEMALPVYLNNSSVSINDCLLATYAILNDAEPLVTFDKKLSTVYPDNTFLP